MSYAHDARIARRTGRVVSRCRRTVVGVAFWIAALFPVVHLGCLVAVALGTLASSSLLWPVAGHGIALAVGHRYRPHRLVEIVDRSEGIRT